MEVVRQERLCAWWLWKVIECVEGLDELENVVFRMRIGWVMLGGGHAVVERQWVIPFVW